MKKLISLELKRNSLKPYNIAVTIIMIVMLFFLYLLAAIPMIEQTESDMEMFLSYSSLIGMSNVVSMAIFSIMSAVLASKLIVEEYSGKKTILLFSYPVERKKILDAKLYMVFLYTVGSMFISCSIILVIFFITENLFPLCPDMLNVKVILNSFFSLLCYSCIAGLLGIISLWFGFKKKSIAVTIIASCIIASIISQFLATLFIFDYGVIGVLIVIFLIVMFVLVNLHHQVRKMEV